MATPNPLSPSESGEPVLESRLLPRISFQTLLVLMTVSAVVFAVAYAADQGGQYAMGAAAGFGFLFAVFVASAAVFIVAWAIAILPRWFGIGLIAIGCLLLFSNFIDKPITPAIWGLNSIFVGIFLLLLPLEKATTEHSPFADDELPPQHLAPRDPTL